jgi:hypothetical protein
MSEKSTAKDNPAQSHQPTTDNNPLRNLFIAEIDPIDQMRIAAEIARHPTYLKNNPEALLIPELAIEVPLAHVATTVKDVATDGLHALGQQGNALMDAGTGLKDLTQGNIPGAFMGGVHFVGAEFSSAGDVLHAGWSLVRQPVEHLGEAALEVAGTGIQVGKDLFDAGVSDQVKAGWSGAKALGDLSTLNLGGFAKNEWASAKDEFNAVGHVAGAVGHTIEGAAKTVMDLF